MRIVAAAIRNPIAVGVTVLLVCLFGTLSLLELPLQLFPDIERPTIGIFTNWRGASPEEAEAELLEPQERVLQGLSGVEEITGNANSGGTEVILTFAIGTDMKAALVDVIGRMSRLPPLPRDADRPVVQLGGLGGDTNQNLTFFFVQLLPGTQGPIDKYRRFIEDVVRPRIESVPGVGGVEINDSALDDVRITVDLQKAAALGVGIPEIARLAASATNVSAGQLDVGRRQYALRYAGRYEVDQLGALVLAWRDGQPVRLSDVAAVETRPPDKLNYSHQNGNPAITLRVIRAPGANVLSTLAEVKRVVAELRKGPLRERGLGMEQSFDASVFITRAVNLLVENLIVGALLALVCVWWFMRNVRATVIIATTIPICLLATFCALHLGARTINVISLAGLAFAVGMVVEGAIVVSGNIIRLRETGLPIEQAAHDGTRQVVPALFASTTTTIAVFLPVLFLEDVEGQIFADLALTISIAVAFSILVAITVVPAAAGRWLGGPARKSGYGEGWPRLTDKVIEWTRTPRQQTMWVLALLVLPMALSWVFLPKLDYLPPVKRAAIDAFFSFPPGMSPTTVDREIVTKLHERMQPYMTGEKEPRLKNYYVLLWPGGGTLGARVVDDERIGELERIVRDEVVVGIPDTRVFVNEGELFGGIGGSARSVAIHLQTSDTAALSAAGAAGRLDYVAEVGTRIRAGERVAKLEDEAVRLQVEDAKAEIMRIEAQRAMSERQLQRIEQLANNSISQTQIDEVRSQLAMLTAQLQQAEVRHRSAKHALEQTEVRAPFSGVVTERLAQRGEYVATGAAIARLVDTVHVEARVQAPLGLLSSVKPNMELPIKVANKQMPATVRTVVPVGEERSRQFELRMILADSAFNVGSAVEVGLPERDATEALVVPRDAIAVRQTGHYLMRIRRDNTAERVAITSIATDGDLVTIDGPVAPGDVVVIRGVERLQDGQRVTIQTRDAALQSRAAPAGA